MSTEKITFENVEGLTLAAAIEWPDDGAPAAFALFAHCFTCGKDAIAASRIARALAAGGIAVLRFDFTGLGGSEGDFANSGFSSNVSDVVSAARFLARAHEAPRLLIGHSLGGAAVLMAARELDGNPAIATIGAPATADHVMHLFGEAAEEIERRGRASVRIGSREFDVRVDFIEDLRRFDDTGFIGELKNPLIVFHSPVDAVVSVNEAARIYQSARHPKSFVSLDDADHLLSRREDVRYVADVLSAWASRYLSAARRATSEPPDLDDGEVLVTERNQKFLRDLATRDHHVIADEPLAAGGSNLGPDPYHLLLMSLGACTSMTLRMVANRKKLPVHDIEVKLSHERVHADDCQDCESSNGFISVIRRAINYRGSLSEDQHRRFIQVADRCPVHKTLEGEIRIETSSRAADEQ